MRATTLNSQNLKTAARIVMLAAALFFAAYYVARDWPSMAEALSRVSGRAILASFFLAVSGMALYPASLWLLYRDLDDRPGAIWPLWQAYSIANVFKYVPGKVATFAALIERAGSHGLSRPKVFQAHVGTLSISIIVGVVMASALVMPVLALSARASWAAATTLGLAVLSLQPAVNAWGLRQAFRVVGRHEVQVQRFSGGGLAKCALVQFMAWSLLGSSFAVVVHATLRLTTAELALCALVFPAAYTIGSLVFVSPAGLGVREGVLVSLVGAVLVIPDEGATGALALAVLGHRLIMTAVDLMLFVIAVSSDRFASDT